MQLSDVFESVAYKVLAAVDLPGGSHQHEVNGSEALKKLFGAAGPVSGQIAWRYFSDDAETRSAEEPFTFYDARARSAERTGRSEWRMYYAGDFLRVATPGDVLILVRPGGPAEEQQVYGLVFAQDSAWLRSARILFGFEAVKAGLETIPARTLNERQLELVRQLILEQLELSVVVPVDPADLQLVREAFGDRWPKTAEMSAFARAQVEVDTQDSDTALSRWIDRETALFRALEHGAMIERIRQGFDSVDSFMKFSLSMHNRRKSRMGHSFEHHLATLFTLRGLHFQQNIATEGKNRPDFLFPGKAAYSDPAFPASRLLMLAAKSTCKDRWRQILTEANRISPKHLCTLESSISTAQTDEMRQQRVVLVVPDAIAHTYTPEQLRHQLNLEGFIATVQATQTMSG